MKFPRSVKGQMYSEGCLLKHATSHGIAHKTVRREPGIVVTTGTFLIGFDSSASGRRFNIK